VLWLSDRAADSLPAHRDRRKDSDDHDRIERPAASPHTVTVSGYAPHGTLVVTGSACFGEVLFGTRVQQRLTFSNVGDCDLHITQVGFEGCRCPGCDMLKLVRNPFPATLHPGASLDLVLQYTATGGSACTRHLVVHSDDSDHSVVTIDVTAMTKMTRNGALQGWLASRLQSLLATRLDHPCDEGTFDPDDTECRACGAPNRPKLLSTALGQCSGRFSRGTADRMVTADWRRVLLRRSAPFNAHTGLDSWPSGLHQADHRLRPLSRHAVGNFRLPPMSRRRGV
jgi:hypothetical protein